jgi:hypothetical protein
VQKPEHLVGKFNHHLAHALVVFADESFFAGDKAAQKSINNFITEPKIITEPKGIDAFQVDSFHRVIMASNDHWIVNAGKDERRFLVLQISDKEKQRTVEYFKPLVEAIPEELPAFRYHLENLDISDFDPRTAPKTKALLEQIAFSADGFEAFIQHVKADQKVTITERGTFGDSPRTILDWEIDRREASKEDIYTAYTQYGNRMKANRLMNDVQFGIRLLDLKLLDGTPWVIRGRRRIPGTDGEREHTYRFRRQGDPMKP